MHPFFEGLVPTLHISHRGGAGLYPENTLHAFSEAVSRHRTDMLELDVHATADGELVVSHDATVDRCTNGRGELVTLTLDSVRALDAGYHWSSDGGVTFPFRGRGIRIPTLREVIEAFPRTRLNIELKAGSPEGVAAFARLLRELGAVDRCCVGSAIDGLGEALLQALPEGCHFFPENALAAFVLGFKGGEIPDPSPYHVLDMPFEHLGVRLVDAALLGEAARQGKWVNVWTIDEVPTMTELVRLGVGGVMTDRPDLLRTVLDEVGGRPSPGSPSVKVAL